MDEWCVRLRTILHDNAPHGTTRHHGALFPRNPPPTHAVQRRPHSPALLRPITHKYKPPATRSTTRCHKEPSGTIPHRPARSRTNTDQHYLAPPGTTAHHRATSHVNPRQHARQRTTLTHSVQQREWPTCQAPFYATVHLPVPPVPFR